MNLNGNELSDFAGNIHAKYSQLWNNGQLEAISGAVSYFYKRNKQDNSKLKWLVGRRRKVPTILPRGLQIWNTESKG